MRIGVALALAVTVFGFHGLATQNAAPRPLQSAGPRQLQGAELFQAITMARSLVDTGLSSEFVVTGEQVLDQQFLPARILTFTPGSKLVLAGPNTDRNERYIIAPLIRVRPFTPGAPPPMITWNPGPALPSAAPVGKAPAGATGSVQGELGGPGADGQIGNAGYPGRSAPIVYVFTDRIEGGPIAISLAGQPGGLGGPGQAGGDGGLGRPGRDAVPGILDCRSGGGNGGNGGNGGAGGMGGPGGIGGNGGTFVLFAADTTLPKLWPQFTVDVAGGAGGHGGPGGEGGRGGKGAPGGSGAGLCRGGSPGSDGVAGTSGPEGRDGPNGAAGVFATLPLTPPQVQTLRLQQK